MTKKGHFTIYLHSFHFFAAAIEKNQSNFFHLPFISDSVVGSSLSELFSLDVLLLFSARFFSCLLTAIALYACCVI